MSLRLTVEDMRARLTELALDLHRIWRHTPDELWGRLDAGLWQATHNRWVVLQTVSRTRLTELAHDPEFRRQLDRLWDEHRERAARSRWFDELAADSGGLRVAYFSMEYMLSEALPIYSGGLGNVAGDQLKAASDLGVPVVGVGLLYQQGYFRQVIGPDGEQRAVYPYNDPSQLPISPVRDRDGEWVRVTVPFAGSPVEARAWQVDVGNRWLYLLDANVPSNRPEVRGITSELYGGGIETRLAQEVLLGIGGVRLLEAMGVEPTVFHLNEGHAAFAIVERAHRFAERNGCSFEEALVTTRAGNLFTTHTPVDAGFDRFPVEVVERYLTRYLRDEAGIDPEVVLDLGRPPGGGDFNMAYLALRGSGAANGVSRLHGQVSRRLFAPLFPGLPLPEVPIGSVTNGIHVETWDDTAARALWAGAVRRDVFTDGLGDPVETLNDVDDSELWRMRSSARAGLVRFVRARWAQQLADAGGDAPPGLETAENLFDPNVLTIGFARRFAAYKRPNLLMRDPDRLARLLSDRERPVQLIVSGKAHPADEVGRAMVRDWVLFSRRPDVVGSVVFLADYDMLLTRQLVQGVDLWVNTPRRPWEASGTSGMKILVNGGLNVSISDGWWAEAYRPGRGWTIDPSGLGEGDDADAEALYRLLEDDIVPRFYDRDEHGVPGRWVATMRESMHVLTPAFSADRTVREYTERYYMPLATSFSDRAAGAAATGRTITAWLERIRSHFPHVHATAPQVDETGLAHLFAYLDDLPVEDVAVELYADGDTLEDPPTIITMGPTEMLVGAENGYRYEAKLPSHRPPGDFTARLRPSHPEVDFALEAPLVTWTGACTLVSVESSEHLS